MCENPIYICNNTKKYNSHLTKVGFWVPCGKCPSCIAAMRDEWFLRAYAEFLDFKEKGGRVFFPTNTYNPESLPFFNTKTGKLCHGEKKYSSNPQCIKCFSKSDVTRYLKKLRKKFENLGIIGVRYLVCSEYGMSSDGTHRPHYHVLIYVPACSLSNKEIEKILDESWNFGFTMFSDLGSEVSSAKAILYVSKYCTKQFDFYKNDVLDDYLNGKDALNHREVIKEYLPKRYNSKHFGIHLAKWLSCKDNIEDFIDSGIADDYLGLSNEGHNYPIPRYIRNKILYTTDENGCRVPTEKGHDILMKLYSNRIVKSERSMSKNFTVQGLRAKIDDEDARIIIKGIEKFDYENSLNGLHKYLCDKMNGRSLRELAIYKVSFRNLLVDDPDVLHEICDVDIDTLHAIGYGLMDESFDDMYYDVYTEKVKDLGKFKLRLLWNNSPRFVDFETVLLTIQSINSLASKRRQRKKTSDDNVVNKLKNVLT